MRKLSDAHLPQLTTNLPTVLVGLGIIALSVTAMPGFADTTETATTEPEARQPITPAEARKILRDMHPTVRARWRRHYGIFASRCVAFENDYVVCPTYDPRFEGSANTTLRDAMDDLTERKRVRLGPNLTKYMLVQPEREDVAAYIRALPRVEMGEWGYIHSGEVVDVIDEDEVVLDDIWLIDAKKLDDMKDKREDDLKEELKQRAEAEERQTGRRVSVDSGAIREKVDMEFKYREKLEEMQGDASFKSKIRLVGFPTAGLIKRMRWSGGAGSDGMQIVIVMQEQIGSSKKPEERFVAIPARMFREGLTEAAFIDMLDQRGMTVTEFVEFMQNAKRDDPKHGDARVFRVLMPPIKPITQE